MKTQNIKEKLLSNQIAPRNTKEKKAGQVTNFRVLFAAYRARVQSS